MMRLLACLVGIVFHAVGNILKGHSLLLACFICFVLALSKIFFLVNVERR